MKFSGLNNKSTCLNNKPTPVNFNDITMIRKL